MQLDAPQRRAVRDLLGLATAVGGITVLPKLWCHCDRYWGFIQNCRFPHVPRMALPFGCPQDALYDPTRWAAKRVRWREHTFLDNSNVPPELRANTVTLRVLEEGAAPAASLSTSTIATASPAVPGASLATATVATTTATATSGAAAPAELVLPYGTRMSDVLALVRREHPGVRVIKVANADLRRLCRWLGSSRANADFNTLTRYILTESSRYCPQEDHGGYGAAGFNWQNPFTAYNCTWGFHAPTPFPTEEAACGTAAARSAPAGTAAGTVARTAGATAGATAPALPQVDAHGEPLPGSDGVRMAERPNSTTCPRIMLCDYNIRDDGSMTQSIKWCNIEGYNGMLPQYKPSAQAMLAKMPGGRCPYPPGDQPGVPGFDRRGHWVG